MLQEGPAAPFYLLVNDRRIEGVGWSTEEEWLNHPLYDVRGVKYKSLGGSRSGRIMHQIFKVRAQHGDTHAHIRRYAANVLPHSAKHSSMFCGTFWTCVCT